MKKPTIEYPCKWPYKVIGSDQALIEEGISTRLGHMQYEMKISNQSRKGKYVSFNVEAHVTSDKERIETFNTLKGIPTVKIVF